MAERQSMTSAEVVAKALIDEHPEFLRDSVAMVATELMEAVQSRRFPAIRPQAGLERPKLERSWRARR